MPKLANASIKFHTNDDDKDKDTHLKVVVFDENRRIAAELAGQFGLFPDHSDNGPFSLVVRNPSTIQQLMRGNIVLRIDPVGHDTWKFNFDLKLIFDDGSYLSASAAGLQLDQERRQQDFGIEGIVRTNTNEVAASRLKAKV